MKIIRYSGFLFLLLFILQAKTRCQDIVYKSDGTVLNVELVAFDGPTIRYKLPGDTSGRIFYLSSSVIDSLRDYKARTITFPKKVLSVRSVRRNYIGTDLLNTFCLNPNITYERLSATGITGISVEFMYNTNKTEGWAVEDYWRFTNNIFIIYEPFYFFAKAGYNYYPFNYSLKRTGTTRVSTGASILLGQYLQEDYSGYEYYLKKQFAAALLWNLGIKVYLADSFLIKADCELSVIPFLVFIVPEAGIQIAF